MASHPERVRRNYPEGVPMFGAKTPRVLLRRWLAEDARRHAACDHAFVYSASGHQCLLCGLVVTERWMVVTC